VNFCITAVVLKSGALKSATSVPLPALVISSFPFAIAFLLPLLLNEHGEKLEVSWPQALDIAQLGVIAFAAFLVFFYVPFLHLTSETERSHYIRAVHLIRDGFLAAGYLYRGWRSRFPDLRRLHFCVSGFMAAYGLLPALQIHLVAAWQWPRSLAAFVADLPALFLLVTAVTWKQEASTLWPEQPEDGPKSMLWVQFLALMLPVSVLALASRMPAQYTRGAWIIVTASFLIYAIRLLLMERQQNQTLSSLRVIEERFSKAFKSSPIAINISRLSDGRVLDANERWFELTKLTRRQAIGKTTVELGVFKSAEERNKLVEILLQQRSIRGMTIDFQLAGRTLNTLMSAEMTEIAGEPVVIVSILDMTELKNVTHQLEQAQKMELVGSLAGGVAHDFNNLLTIITGHSALALTIDLNSELREHIHQIKEAAWKAASLTRQLLAFSRRQVLQPRNISLNTVVVSIQQLLHRTIGENIVMMTSLDPHLGTVYADPAQMEQVLMNLAVNARDAMPQGGTLLFETKNLDLPLPYPEKAFEIPVGPYVMLTVSDTGMGIRPGDLARIFEPFFTTKAVGAGTGLGLSTVYGIVKQSRGYIWACSELGAGTAFKVCLPRIDSQPDIMSLAETETEDLKGNETLLVIDDDPRVCELMAKILGQYGYRVITANSSDEADRRAEQYHEEIRLLITDLMMPGMCGKDLAQKLKATRPDLRILYISGYSPLVPPAENHLDLDAIFLPKPFAPLDLARHVKKALIPAKCNAVPGTGKPAA
jgi:PAS domain S-box-containing protein